MNEKRRSTDRGWHLVVRENWYRDLWLLLITGAVLFVLAVSSDTNRRVARNQQGNTAALCAFRDDLQRRVTSGQSFLASHPSGIPGIPAPTILQGIENERSTLDALQPLICPKPRKPKGHASAARP